MVKRFVKKYFHPDRVRLAEEVKEHPKLVEILAELVEQGIGPDEFEMRLAAIAAYCAVALDGEYTQKDLDILCDILCTKLKKKRTIIFN